MEDHLTDRLVWRLTAAVLAAVAVAAPARCLELEIAVEAITGNCPSAEMVATSSAGRNDWQMPVPSSAMVDLDPNHAWTISARCPGLWAQHLHIEAHSATEEVQLRLVPAGTLKGRIEVAEGLAPSDRIELLLQPAKPGAEVGWDSARIGCSLDADLFNCDVPAGEVDLRLGAEGFAPHYAWQVRLAAGETLDLGTVKLIEGASVAGSVVLPRERDEAAASTVAEIVVAPLVEGALDAEEQRRLQLRQQRARTDESGRFQVTGLSAGTYELSVRLAGHSPASISPVALSSGEEWFLERPIALDPLVTLDVYLDPPQDVEGRPWRLRLLGEPRGTAGATLREEIAEGAATTAGHWSAEGLATGPYLLQVEDAEGSNWSSLPVDATASLAPIFVELPAVTVEGRVLRGDEPVAAELIFGTTSGSPSVRLESDDEGNFRGVLPHEGEWPLEISVSGRPPQALDPVEVERGTGGVAELTLRLPDTRLAGEVVNATGEPVAGAHVLVVRETARALAAEREVGAEQRRRREAALRTDEDGHFSTEGLLPASLSVVAYDRTRTSRWHQVELAEDSPSTPLRMVLEERLEVIGQVTTPDGPAVGATVVGFSRDRVAPLDLFAQAVTTADGRFSFEVASDTRLLDLFVAAPGYDVLLRRVTLGSRPIAVAMGKSGGRLLLTDLHPGTTLLHAGAELPLETLASLLMPLGRLDFAEDGLWITGIEPGGYSLCWQRGGVGCDSGNLTSGTELTLQANPSDEPEATP